MSNVTTAKPLYIIDAALEEQCAPLTIRREIQLGRISAELEIVKDKPTYCINRQSFEAWAAKRKARTAKAGI